MEDDGQEEHAPSAFSRHRSPTFSPAEVKLLLNLVEKYKTIIFNKTTTSAACHAKEVAWVKITKAFNRQGFNHKRSVDCLKIKLDNMKRNARNLCKNLIDTSYSVSDEVTSQLAAMMCEVENSSGAVEDPVDSDEDLNETENHKASTEGDWDANQDKDSNDSSMDEVLKKNERSLNRSMNFSMNECNLLLHCVRQEKSVVFSKMNTSSFIKLKNRAWDRITNSYNKLSPQKRSTKVLRTKFSNMRRLVKSNKINKYFKQFKNSNHKLKTTGNEIKCEPLFESQSSMDADNDSDDYIEPEPDNKSNIDENNGMDPLNTVLNSDSGSIQENNEVIRLKIQLLKYKLETEKLKRKRIEDLIQADAVERESKARESSLKLRTARLEAIAAEMKLPPSHPALAYTAEETRAQHYIHQYHAP